MSQSAPPGLVIESRGGRTAHSKFYSTQLHTIYVKSVSSLSLQDGQITLSDGCVRAPVRRGARILGPGLESGGALLLDDLYAGNELVPPRR